MTQPIRVFITDDHTIIRTGMRAVLELEADIVVVGEAENGRQAVERIPRLQPDVVLMDLVMPEMDGIAAIEQIKALCPEVRILVLTTFAGEEMILPAIKAGALGYQLKDSKPDELVAAIRQVCQGESALHPVIARKILQSLAKPASKTPAPDPLTARELEVLRLVAQGLTNDEIAQQLVISGATVRTHVSHVLGKLHLATRTQAALYALREGIASLDMDA
jgi:NarL family two-component system response regulator LiaR